MNELTGTFKTLASTASAQELEAYADLLRLLHESPLPDDEALANLELYQSRAALGRILFMHDLYTQALDVPGVVMEFGVRWGRNLALFHSLRNLYEPHNYSRRIVGFDTFEGFPGGIAAAGAYSVPKGYEDYLGEVLSAHEQLSPRGHLRRFDLVKGDVRETLPAYLSKHPETIIALAYFDLDLYEPARACLEAIAPYLTAGSVVGFDQLSLPEFPGETEALRDVWGLGVNLRRSPLSQYSSYLVWGG